jgi:DNA topoisomerase IA
MKVRQWMSDFLYQLASRMDATPPQSSPPTASETVVPSETVPAPVSGQRPVAELPTPVQASPRSPELPPSLVAAYWRAALKHVDFNALRKDKNRPLLQLPLREVAERSTEVDPQEEGQVKAEDVDVVLFLWENGPGGKPGKRRHPLMAVPAVQIENHLAPRTDAAPVLNPAYLVPEPRGDAFRYADLDQANHLLTQALTGLANDNTLKPGWDTWWNASLQVFFELCEIESEQDLLQLLSGLADASSNEASRLGWQLRVGTFAGQGSGVKSISDAYSSYLDAAKTPAVPLFARFCGSETADWAKHMPAALHTTVVGHIDEYDSAKDNRPLFPLDPSQRLAVRAITSLQDGELQAVNGPPGSGKTSMLRAVVASRWVSAALEQGECPIIVACGATNQSVTNVIEAFGKAPHPDDRLMSAQRWIDEVPSYGAYFPSASVLKDERKAPELARFICVTASRGSGMLWEYHKRSNVLDPTRALEMEERYLQYARRGFEEDSLVQVEDVVSLLWKELARTVAEGEDFARVAAQGGSRLQVMLDDSINSYVSELWPDDRVNALNDLRKKLTSSAGDVEAAQGIVDLIWRPRAFHLAGRYWEGRFLLAQRERLFSRHPLNVEESLRRLCMLTPCLVSTLHNVANCFRFQVPHGEDPNHSHLLSIVDLLVIDEAGQASPELAGAALMLARRAAVIGDLKQLAPIWSHNELSEVAIAASVGAFDQINPLRQSRRSVADGSVLAAARLVSRWREDDDLGITLRYHYRCRPSIIGYCNSLCYEGKLVPRTREGVGSPEPALAWVAIRHDPQKAGGSLYNSAEVDHITTWVAERWPVWMAHPSTKGRRLADIVALITAYRAQADRLRQSLQTAFERCRRGKGEWPSVEDIDKVTIGTVHQLQGAERPIVCFSLVEGPEHAAGSFMDRDGALLNVAVSRAKTSFIVFGHPGRLFPPMPSNGENPQGLAPIHALGHYLRTTEQAQVLYPKQLVVIEAGGKLQTLGGILGKASKVVCTGGALHNLPIGAGVDVGAGLVPRPHLQLNAEAFLTQTDEALGAVSSLVLATDDDRMGEFIAWQVLQALDDKILPDRISRVRLGSINGPSVRAAFAHPAVLDERKVLAEAAREVVDCLVSARLLNSRLKSTDDADHVTVALADRGACTLVDPTLASLKSVGRVQAAVLRLLLERARECVAQAGKSRIRIKVDIEGRTLTGHVLNLGEQRALTSTEAVPGIIERIRDKPLVPMGPPVVVREQVEVPRAGTFSVLGEAWRRFLCPPWDAMEALQRLYEGSWANIDGAGDFEPEIPVSGQDDAGGHPPITPLDLAAHPDTVAPIMVSADCQALYQVIWDRHELAADGPYELTQLRLDLRFEGLEKQGLGVRFEVSGCDGLTDEQLALLLESSAVSNDAEHLITYWTDLPDAPRQFDSESASRWQMTPDQLLADMQMAHIGRPSTCARTLHGLEKKGLVEMPIQTGQLRLTPSGVATALALEACEPRLSSPAFCAYLSKQLERIERGDLGPREVLSELLPDLVPDCPDMADVQSRIWNSLAELEQARQVTQTVRSGGLVSAASDEAHWV